MTEPQNTMTAVPGAEQPRNLAAFALDQAGLDVPGVESPHHYISIVSQQLPALGEIESMYAKYEMGLSQIRGDADLTDDQRLDLANDLHETATTRYQQLTAQLDGERAEKHASIERSLFGAPGGDGTIYVDADLEATRARFTQASQNLLGASEEQLAQSVELAKITGDAVLLRAARAVARQQGFEEVVRTSLQSNRDLELYAQRQAVPSAENLGIITGQYAPPSASLSLDLLQPDPETRRRAEEQSTARETRRQQQRLGR